MADLLEQSSAWLDDQRRRFMSRTVVYSRAGDSLEVLATVGRTTGEAADDDGLIQKWESRDYLILTEDLAAFGLPRAGDRITEAAGDEMFVYEVMPMPGEPAWRWSDPYRRTLRIHTKQVGA